MHIEAVVSPRPDATSSLPVFRNAGRPRSTVEAVVSPRPDAPVATNGRPPHFGNAGRPRSTDEEPGVPSGRPPLFGSAGRPPSSLEAPVATSGRPPLFGNAGRPRSTVGEDDSGKESLGLYTILFYFDAFVHKSIILLSPPPTCTARTIAILLHVYCAIYDAPPPPPCVFHTRYNIDNNNIV